MWHMLLRMFQSSFELTGYITRCYRKDYHVNRTVSKLFRAYGLYNSHVDKDDKNQTVTVSKLFRAYGLYNEALERSYQFPNAFVSKLFRAYGLYN